MFAAIHFVRVVIRKSKVTISAEMARYCVYTLLWGVGLTELLSGVLSDVKQCENDYSFSFYPVENPGLS